MEVHHIYDKPKHSLTTSDVWKICQEIREKLRNGEGEKELRVHYEHFARRECFQHLFELLLTADESSMHVVETMMSVRLQVERGEVTERDASLQVHSLLTKK